MLSKTLPHGLVLALGGGGAKGLAHIGVLQVLEEQAIPVRAVVGTSVGAEVGAFLAVGMPMAELVSLATSFDWKRTLQLFLPDLSTSGGFASGKNIMEFLSNGLGQGCVIEALSIGYAAVATDLETGKQVVLDRGSLIDAVRASISMPALLAPYAIGGRLLVDGCVVNPVPFDVAHAVFGGPVLAVAVNAGALSLIPQELQVPTSPPGASRGRQLLVRSWMKLAAPIREWWHEPVSHDLHHNKKPVVWNTHRVFDRAMDITSAQLMQLRLQLQPPDLMLAPDVRRIGTLEFYRGKEAIAAGRAAATARLPEIHELLRTSTEQVSRKLSDVS